MGQTVRFQEILRRLAIIDEGFVEDQAGLGLGLPASRLLDPKTAALVRVGALVAIGSPGVCLAWSTTRALAEGATEDEITDVLLAIAPVAGLGRVAGAIPDLAAALGYDAEAALVDPDDRYTLRPPAGGGERTRRAGGPGLSDQLPGLGDVLGQHRRAVVSRGKHRLAVARTCPGWTAIAASTPPVIHRVDDGLPVQRQHLTDLEAAQH